MYFDESMQLRGGEEEGGLYHRISSYSPDMRSRRREEEGTEKERDRVGGNS